MAQIRQIASLNRADSVPINTWKRRTLAIGPGACGMGLLAAMLYLAPQPAAAILVLLGLGMPLLLLLWLRPEFGLLGLIFLGANIVKNDTVDLRLSIGGGLDLRDLVLIGLFMVAFLKEIGHGTLKVPWWPAGGLLLLFLAMAAFSTFHALAFEQVESNWALGDLRILILYAAFFITSWIIKQAGQLKTLLTGLFIIADLAALIVYLQQFSGAGNPLLEAMVETRDWRVYQMVGGVRVVPAAQVLMHFMWFIALGILILGRPKGSWKTYYAAQLFFIGGGHLFTYMRAQWVAFIIGVGLVFIVLAPRYRQYSIKSMIFASCLVLLLTGLIARGPQAEASANPFLAGLSYRFGSLFSPSETAETESLQWREYENTMALRAILKQPLTGLGLGNRYRPLSTHSSEASGSLTDGNLDSVRISRFTRYAHNSYAAIAVKMGIPGLIVLLWFFAVLMVNGFKAYRELPDSEGKGVILGVLAGFSGLFFWSYFHAHLIKAESTATIGIMAAVIGIVSAMHGNGAASPSVKEGG